MKKATLLAVGAIATASALVGAVYFRGSLGVSTVHPTMQGQGASSTVVAGAADPFVVPSLGNTYKNDTYRFSLSIPDGFSVRELPADENGAHTIILQNPKGDGIQILVTPNQGDTKVLTAADVRSSIPNMKVIGEQEVEIGADYKGVAFMSDNDAFQGNSREVWFYFRGNLYQISTYARLDPLLKAMFATWRFF